MKNRYLLVKTKENTELLTVEENLPSLIEFAKTFDAELILVEPFGEYQIYTLQELTAALCSPDHSNVLNYRRIQSLVPKSKPKRQRKEIIADADRIRKFIRKNLLSGRTVSLKSLKDKYRDFKLTDACLCNHLSKTRESLAQEGHRFSKLGAGKYRILAISK